MKQLAALLAVTALSLVACDQRAPTEPGPPAPLFAEATGERGDATHELRLNGTATADPRLVFPSELDVPMSIVGGVPGELCDVSGRATAQDGSANGPGRTMVRIDGNVTHFSVAFTSPTAWNDGLVNVTAFSSCLPSGTSSRVEGTVQVKTH